MLLPNVQYIEFSSVRPVRVTLTQLFPKQLVRGMLRLQHANSVLPRRLIGINCAAGVKFSRPRASSSHYSLRPRAQSGQIRGIRARNVVVVSKLQLRAQSPHGGRRTSAALSWQISYCCRSATSMCWQLVHRGRATRISGAIDFRESQATAPR